MAIIGTFNREGDGFTGTIATLALKTKTVIKQVAKSNDQAPDFRVYAAGVEIGAGWSAISKTGKSYLSLRVDDPSFASPIHARLIGLDDGSQTLIWSR
jgi:uncharacterized protein (DUF736 family)